MPKPTRALVVLWVILLIAGGCRTVTGRSAGQWISDKTTTAKVKAAVASARFGTMSRVDVDTNQGTVFLTGVARDEEERQRILEAARMAADDKPVRDNLALGSTRVQASEETASASPPTQPQVEAMMPPAQSHLASATTPPLTRLKFGRLEPEAAAMGRFAAYDRRGQRVATVYTVSVSELRQSGISTLHAGNRSIDHISIYPQPGTGDAYQVVLWHVNRAQAQQFE